MMTFKEHTTDLVQCLYITMQGCTFGTKTYEKYLLGHWEKRSLWGMVQPGEKLGSTLSEARAMGLSNRTIKRQNSMLLYL